MNNGNPWKTMPEPYCKYIWCEHDHVFRQQFPQLIPSNYKTVIAELGIGTGALLRDMAVSNPDVFFIGIDLFYRPLGKTAKRLHRSDVRENVKLLRYNANHPAILFPDNFLDGVVINFPEPWPKKRHHKNRIVYGPAAGHFRKVLKKDGWLFFQSDDYSYFQSAHELFEQERFEITLNTYPTIIKDTFKSSFHNLFESKSTPIYCFLAKS